MFRLALLLLVAPAGGALSVVFRGLGALGLCLPHPSRELQSLPCGARGTSLPPGEPGSALGIAGSVCAVVCRLLGLYVGNGIPSAKYARSKNSPPSGVVLVVCVAALLVNTWSEYENFYSSEARGAPPGWASGVVGTGAQPPAASCSPALGSGVWVVWEGDCGRTLLTTEDTHGRRARLLATCAVPTFP